MPAWSWLLLSYLCGSVPFGWLLGRLAGVDIRKAGSGNIGATNLYRQCGARYGVAALLLDAAKGAVSVLAFAPRLAMAASPDPDPAAAWPPLACGLAAILGHAFPVWFRFKGGKTVATSAGVAAALFPGPFAGALAVFVAVVAGWRYISLGSMAAAAALAVLATVLAPDPGGADAPRVAFAWLVAGLVAVLHRGNLRRLRRGEEPRFRLRRAPAATAAATPEDAAGPSPSPAAPPPAGDAP